MSDPGLFRTIYTTRALRRFRDDQIPEEVLFQIVDAAIRAPSGQNAQDWRFVLVTAASTKQRLQQWAWEGWSRYQPKFAEHPELMDDLPRRRRLPLRAVEHLVRNLGTVPAIVAVCAMRGRHSTPGGSTFPAVQNLLLAARGLGLGASIFNLPLVRRDDVNAALGVPGDYEIHCLVPIGYPRDRHGPVSRKPVRDVAFWNRWNERWPYAEAQPDDGRRSRWT